MHRLQHPKQLYESWKELQRFIMSNIDNIHIEENMKKFEEILVKSRPDWNDQTQVHNYYQWQSISDKTQTYDGLVDLDRDEKIIRLLKNTKNECLILWCRPRVIVNYFGIRESIFLKWDESNRQYRVVKNNPRTSSYGNYNHGNYNHGGRGRYNRGRGRGRGRGNGYGRGKFGRPNERMVPESRSLSTDDVISNNKKFQISDANVWSALDSPVTEDNASASSEEIKGDNASASSEEIKGDNASASSDETEVNNSSASSDENKDVNLQKKTKVKLESELTNLNNS